MGDGPNGVRVIGRRVERWSIDDARRRRRSLVVAGHVGVGKTQLLAWATESAQRDRCTVVRVHGSEAMRDVPLSAFGDLIGPPAVQAAPNQQFGLVLASLTNLGESGAGLLVVDDAHWLDDGSMGVVRELLRRHTCPVLVATRPHADVLAALLGVGGEHPIEIIDLATLDKAESAELAAAHAAGRLSPNVMEAITDRASGNPLFVRELVRDALEHAARHGAGAPALGESASAVIIGRLGRLDEAARAQLERLAVAEPVSLALLEQLGSSAAVADLERRGLVHIITSGARAEVAITHPLIRDAVNTTADTVTLRRRGREVADAIVATGMRREGDALKVATLLYAAGSQPSASVAARAALAAIARGGLDQAHRLATDAHQQSPTIEHAQLLGWTHFYLGRVPEALAVAKDAACRVHNEDDRVALASFRVVLALHGELDVDGAQAVIDEIDGSVSAVGQQVLDATAAGISLYRGNLTDSISRFESVRDTGSSSVANLLWSATPAAIALTLHGRPDEARDVLAGLIVDVEVLSLEFPTLGSTLDCEHALALAWGGQLAAAQRQVADGLGVARKHSVLPAVHLHTLVGGQLAALSDDHAEHVAALRQFGLLRGSAYAMWAPYTAVHLAAAAHRAGDSAAGDDMLHYYELTKCRGMELCEPTLRRALGERAAAAGALADAARLFTDGLAAAESQGNVTEALMNGLRLGALDCDSVALVDAHRLVSSVHGRLGEQMSTFVSHLAGDPQRSMDVAHDLVAGGYVMLARDLVGLAAAQVGRAAGDVDRWSRAALPARGAPATVRSIDLSQLTSRERDVATHVATGASDAAIAQALGISIRTVHAHLRSTYSKLGITQRAQLRRHGAAD